MTVIPRSRKSRYVISLTVLIEAHRRVPDAVNTESGCRSYITSFGSRVKQPACSSRSQPVELVFRRVVSSLTSRQRAVAAPYEETPFHKAEGPCEAGMAVKICIVGCGELGSVIAAHLARVDDV